MSNTRTDNTDKSPVTDISGNADDHENLGMRLKDLYDDIVKSVEKNKNRYPLNTMHENEVSRDNFLSYLALRQHVSVGASYI